jgi:hypothetical protein
MNCTCGQQLEDDDIPGGQVMAIVTEDRPGAVRAKIIYADFRESLEPEMEILWTGSWVATKAKADREAQYRYWPLYEFRHGFKHPQDPRRTSADAVPEAGVCVMSDIGLAPR